MSKLLFLFLFEGIYCQALPPAVTEVRLLFERAFQDENTCSELLEKLDDTGSNALLMGYKAATQALLGKHAMAPWSKYNHCRDSEKTFFTAVQMDPQNIEIRYLRFTVQANLPGFLNMSRNLEEDKKILLSGMRNSTDRVLNKKIAQVLLQSGQCTSSETVFLKPFLQENKSLP